MSRLPVIDDCQSAAEVMARARRTTAFRAEMMRQPPVVVQPEPPPIIEEKPPPAVVVKPPEPFRKIVVQPDDIPNFLSHKGTAHQNLDRFDDHPFITVKAVIIATAEHYNLPVTEFLSARQTWNVTKPRQVAMYLAKKLTRWSYPYIGRRFGGRDHTTILHGIRAIEARIAAGDDKLIADIAEIERKVAGA